ncbi:fatty-acid O-methyltransferase Mtf2 [Mycobacterium sp. GA-1841]|uniref:fatty-acid O-methyltransferase Mtf2 n=1 Tax=Mycobacterium sp. GA-1841 TaxID=1834154 RepID=UPI0009F8B8D0|nr:class I SAM-dependent methyltransferase [Mycobacterium sp. GA-1841]
MALRDAVRDGRDRFVKNQSDRIVWFAQKFIYPYATRRLQSEDVVFLNYGYEEDPALAVPLADSDESNRYFIQLYHATATQADLAGKRVLEVGCGHGGGASYLARTLSPASYTGMDLNPEAVAFCQKRHRVPDLEFIRGDAEDLPFADGTFDAVINVESSHLYPHFPRFLDEVTRVLRPGGRFLYTDVRMVAELPTWEDDLAASPLQMLTQRTINAEVVRGMEKNLAQWRHVFERATPAPLRWLTRKFEPARRACEDLRPGGSSAYRMYSFAKP